MSEQLSKQELAKLIWESAQKMRGSIEAAKYKDYIFGFMFYKFLSEKEVNFLKSMGMPEDQLSAKLTENNESLVKSIQDKNGYFIEYKHLFSTWKELGMDFSIDNVRTALSAFNRHINNRNKKMQKVYTGIFDTMQANLKDLGNTDAEQSKVARALISTIDKIPMDGKGDYDVLGYVYEYLLKNFAAGAGKKAGEFYSPSEIAQVISTIIAHHHKDKDKISVYDMAAGSSSLLITVGKAVSKHMNNPNGVKYYAQELITETYNLARMNLVMKGVIPDNIVIRNGNTLSSDWPFFEDDDKEGTYEPVWVDAVAANPPYSAHYDQSICEGDPRFDYGIAPASKADYAFLLHGLYHLNDGGIMGIVLPHGVLFRGGEEETIRTNLVEHHHISAIIGLPAGIFFGTGIPTIIAILQKKREESSILFIDASKEFKKEGKQNVLRARDIKKITDTVIGRKEIPGYSRIVTLDEIKENGYNLNIPRYVDSSEKTESYDIYASMFGGIPEKEIKELSEFWNAFPGLKEEIFDGKDYCTLKNESVSNVINEHKSVKDFISSYKNNFSDFGDFMTTEIIDSPEKVHVNAEEDVISDNIFERIQGFPLIDKYEVYQILADSWRMISSDLEMIVSEGLDACRAVDPNMVLKKKQGKEESVQEGWKGRIVPFELAQKSFMKDQLNDLISLQNEAETITGEYDSLIEMLDDDEKDNLLDDENVAFVSQEVTSAFKEVLNSVETSETKLLNEYLLCTKKKDKQTFIEEHSEFDWSSMEPAKDGTYSKSVVNKRITAIKKEYEFNEGSYEYVLSNVSRLIEKEAELKKAIKKNTDELHTSTKEVIENLTDKQVRKSLYNKWIAPIVEGINDIPSTIIANFVKKVETLAAKYETTMDDIEGQIQDTENSLITMLGQLTGNEYDTKGLKEFAKLLGAEDDD